MVNGSELSMPVGVEGRMQIGGNLREDWIVTHNFKITSRWIQYKRIEIKFIELFQSKGITSNVYDFCWRFKHSLLTEGKKNYLYLKSFYFSISSKEKTCFPINKRSSAKSPTHNASNAFKDPNSSAKTAWTQSSQTFSIIRGQRNQFTKKITPKS